MTKPWLFTVTENATLHLGGHDEMNIFTKTKRI